VNENKIHCKSLVKDSQDSLNHCMNIFSKKVRDKTADLQEKKNCFELLSVSINQAKSIDAMGGVLGGFKNLKNKLLSDSNKVEFDPTSAFTKLEQAEQYVANQFTQQSKRNDVSKVHAGGPLQEVIGMLSKPGNKHEQLQELFNSPLGAKLAGGMQQNGHDAEEGDRSSWNPWKNGWKKIVNEYGYMQPHKETLDTQSMKQFIKLYREAIDLESKPNREKKPGSHRERKNRRLAAIDEIEKFISAQNETGHDYEQHCQLACQALMRVREPNFVCQKTIPRCGGFAVLQHAWRDKPDVATKILLDLYLKNKTVVNALNNQPVEIKSATPEKIRQTKEALADAILTCSFYTSDSVGSTVLEDAYVAGFFGLKPLLYVSDRESGGEYSKESLSELLQSVSINGGVISLGVKSKLIDKLQDTMVGELNEGWSRKAAIRKPVLLRFTGREDASYANHSISIEDFKCDDKNVYIKVYSWGKAKRYTLDKNEFFSQIDENSILIYPSDNELTLHGAAPPKLEDNFLDSRGNTIYVDCYGNRKELIPNTLYKGEVTRCAYYTDNNRGIFFVRPDENIDVVFTLNRKDAVRWDKSNSGQEQLTKTIMSGKWVVANRQGEMKVLEKKKYVKGFDNKEYCLQSDHESSVINYRIRDL
ncbi:hypothetical protein N9V90_02070, partial [Endozoicomonas sp.]|nr:hypothetical protein [Endozoicomonas sp.]